jgi:aminoglycoside 6'-N-acetyltransferase
MLLFQFKSLENLHLSFIYQWLQNPHVSEWYRSKQQWTQEEVEKKYHPEKLRLKRIEAFIIYFNRFPIGYIQKYHVHDYPWEQFDQAKLPLKLAGIDLFIGDPNFIQQGMGSHIIKQFLTEQIEPFFEGCLVDPRHDNLAAIRCYEKVGFKFHQKVLCEREVLILMKKLFPPYNDS